MVFIPCSCPDPFKNVITSGNYLNSVVKLCGIIKGTNFRHLQYTESVLFVAQSINVLNNSTTALRQCAYTWPNLIQCFLLLLVQQMSAKFLVLHFLIYGQHDLCNMILENCLNNIYFSISYGNEERIFKLLDFSVGVVDFWIFWIFYFLQFAIDGKNNSKTKNVEPNNSIFWKSP
jgi:hypothetical protein